MEFHLTMNQFKYQLNDLYYSSHFIWKRIGRVKVGEVKELSYGKIGRWKYISRNLGYALFLVNFYLVRETF